MAIQKYIVVKADMSEAAILFPGNLTHADVARSFKNRVISAGFCDLTITEQVNGPDEDLVEVRVYGESDSLKIGNRGDEDEMCIRIGLRVGA